MKPKELIYLRCENRGKPVAIVTTEHRQKQFTLEKREWALDLASLRNSHWDNKEVIVKCLERDIARRSQSDSNPAA